MEVDICVQEDDVWPVVVVGREDADETNKADFVFVKVDKMHYVWYKKLAWAQRIVKVCEVGQRSSVSDLSKEFCDVENKKHKKEEEEVGGLGPS